MYLQLILCVTVISMLIANNFLSAIRIFRHSIELQSHLHPRIKITQSNRLFMSNLSSKLEWPVSRVRSQFIEYFVDKKQHVNYKSSPVVPVNDPTLLFANAGMNQFKPIFLGTVDPSSPYSGLKRVVNSQKCIRAGGKHNDLEDVGKDTYHHTFFEMLGTWSFGNYFKAEAIEWAYDILVNVYKLPSERLYATYFGGDVSLGLSPDNEARELWLKYLPPERVLPFDKKANFWEMGDTGPCGPCSEIHFDRIGNRDASAYVNADDPNVIEIWNLVFIQFNREKSGELRPLPEKHIDTGMGLERLTSILQAKSSNYDTDVFDPIFQAIQQEIKCQPYTAKLGQSDKEQGYKDTAYRVIADHIRTLTFAITDGAVPSNEGRGYVLRRILRRAVRYGMQNLGAKPGFFAKLVPIVVREFGEYFSEIKEKQDYVMSVITEEEQSFASLVDRGIKYFNEIVSNMKSSENGGTVISGERAFYLYDSLGFPLDLTQLMAQEQGFSVDIEGFQDAMNAQKERGRAATRAKRLAGLNALTLGAEQTSYLQKTSVPVTDDSLKYVWDISPQTKVQAIYTGNSFIETLNTDHLFTAKSDSTEKEVNTVGFILEQTPFYAESGGQIADTGTLVFDVDGSSITFDVVDVQVFAGYVVHIAVLSDNNLSTIPDNFILSAVNKHVTANVDYTKRRKIAPNHTMTHVLNYALRDELKLEVDQKGSQVSDEKLRFDFTLNRAMQLNEIAAVESKVNEIIKKELDVSSAVVPLKQAQSINGLRAVFGEVYPDPVRVISIGAEVDALINEPTADQWRQYSVEFCGGTHLKNTKEAVAFVILEETAVAKGIRRISAVTGSEAVNTLKASEGLADEASLISNQIQNIPTALSEYDADLDSLANSLDGNIVVLRNKLDSSVISQIVKSNLRSQIEKMQKELNSLKGKLSLMKADQSIKALVENVQFVQKQGLKRAVFLTDLSSDSKVTKKAIDEIRKSSNDNLSFLVVMRDTDADRLNLVAFVTNDDQISGLNANQWINQVLSSVGGRGGGKSNLAQGSTNGIAQADTLVKIAEQVVANVAKV